MYPTFPRQGSGLVAGETLPAAAIVRLATVCRRRSATPSHGDSRAARSTPGEHHDGIDGEPSLSGLLEPFPPLSRPVDSAPRGEMPGSRASNQPNR